MAVSGKTDITKLMPLLAALLGGMFALMAQYVAHRLAIRRERQKALSMGNAPAAATGALVARRQTTPAIHVSETQTPVVLAERLGCKFWLLWCCVSTLSYIVGMCILLCCFLILGTALNMIQVTRGVIETATPSYSESVQSFNAYVHDDFVRLTASVILGACLTFTGVLAGKFQIRLLRQYLWRFRFWPFVNGAIWLAFGINTGVGVIRAMTPDSNYATLWFTSYINGFAAGCLGQVLYWAIIPLLFWAFGNDSV